MPNASSTQPSSINDTLGNPAPLCYGYVWVTGKRAAYYQLQDTGHSNIDYTRAGIWLLGEGEWDGCNELWSNDVLVWRGDTAIASTAQGYNWIKALDNANQPIMFNFHAGTDATIGSGFTPSSYGPDQGLDVIWKVMPPAINPLHYSRVAYYALMRKQPVENQTNTHQNDATQWTDISPIGLWRAMKCRLFDANGAMTAYAFTTNPVWHWVDVRLRRKIFPEYNLSISNGIDDLSTGARACFDWTRIYSAAQYCDEILANGRRRFQGSYSFATATSLQAIEAQIAKVCRGYYTAYAGACALNIDRPRSVVFTFKREHLLPGSFSGTEQTPHTAANRIIGKFRDVLVPQCSEIQSITCTANGRPILTTKEPHPFAAGDYMACGGTDTTYDGEWQVHSVPDVINPGTTSAIYPSTMTLERKGSNYPASVGAVGGIGLLYSRFAERTPLFRHKANSLARGAVAIGVPRQQNPVKDTIDLATSTYDQAARISNYELARSLGIDTLGADGQMSSSYVVPKSVRISVSQFIKDDAGNLACAVEPGDRVRIDDSVSVPYAGDYEVLDPKTVRPITAEVGSSDGKLSVHPSSRGGEIDFTLGEYNESYMFDASDDAQAGYPSVPGSDPGNETNYTGIDLADGGTFVFFTGVADSATQFQLPSTGFSVANMLAWASAAGTNVQYHSAHTIRLCDASATRQLTLTYSDNEGRTWTGAVGYAAVAWLDSAVPVTAGGMSWIVLTLLGGEQIAFGQGILADGATVTVPTGFTLDPDFCVAFIHDQAENGNIMFMAGADVDAGGVVHVNVSDHTGHTWHGNGNVLAFAYKNNAGTFTTETVSGATWAKCVLSNGKKFGVGVSKDLANGASFGVPADAGAATTLQAIAGSSYGYNVDGSDHAQGIGGCYLDASNNVVIFFQNGSGKTWYGKADIFGLYCESGDATPTLVSVSPASVTIAAGTQQLFTAVVSGNTNASVTWSVDGVAGGNGTVGTIDATGLYSAPAVAGTHIITATSVADPTASGSATVTITGGGGGAGGFIVVED